MANEITVTAQLAYANPAFNINSLSLLISTGGSAQFTITGKNYMRGTMAVPTTAGGTAIPLGGVSTPGGIMCFKNLDSTNYLQILTAVSGTVIIRIYPGECFPIRLDATLTAPAALSHTAICEMEYLILEN